MSGFGHDHETTHQSGAIDLASAQASDAGGNTTQSEGSSMHSADVATALETTLSSHSHAPPPLSPYPATTAGAYEQQTGTQGQDRLIGSGGNDFLAPGDDTFRFNGANSADGEFPFPTDSPASSQATVELRDGTLRIQGNSENLDGAPLFSQGERSIDPNAAILNGSNPEALIDGFLQVPNDREGNSLSGTHLHFSPAGDDRGNFADATVVRFLDDQATGDRTAAFSGEFELSPEEQAVALAGNLYVNVHTNLDTDGDGKAGFPTGENRLNLNQNVVEFV